MTPDLEFPTQRTQKMKEKQGFKSSPRLLYYGLNPEPRALKVSTAEHPPTLPRPLTSGLWPLTHLPPAVAARGLSSLPKPHLTGGPPRGHCHSCATSPDTKPALSHCTLVSRPSGKLSSAIPPHWGWAPGRDPDRCRPHSSWPHPPSLPIFTWPPGQSSWPLTGV